MFSEVMEVYEDFQVNFSQAWVLTEIFAGDSFPSLLALSLHPLPLIQGESLEIVYQFVKIKRHLSLKQIFSYYSTTHLIGLLIIQELTKTCAVILLLNIDTSLHVNLYFSLTYRMTILIITKQQFYLFSTRVLITSLPVCHKSFFFKVRS